MTVRPPDPTQLESWEAVLLRTAHDMSLSPTQYQLIEQRYGTLQDALNAATDPLLSEAHIFIQGSIRLRTTIQPAAGAEEDMATIDADAVVWLPNAGSATASKVLEVVEKRFRESTRVNAPIEPLRRGIRIVYADEDPGFHIDITPARCAPNNRAEKGQGALLVPDRHVGWKESSPIPYSDWLDRVSREQIQIVYDDLAERVTKMAEATQAPIPDYGNYMQPNPLRAAVKLLKRHRDEWAIEHHAEKVRPISAVITTLAAHAYTDVARLSATQPMRTVEAIMAIVAAMPHHIVQGLGGYAVLNPLDRGENFAEKWNRPQGEGAAYKQAFDAWHVAALRDIRLGLEDFGSAIAFREAVAKRFGVSEWLVEDVVKNIPNDWTLPGRAEGTTRNALALSRLTGAASAGAATQIDVRPVGRLG